MRVFGAILVFLIALTCGGVASVLAYNYLKNYEADTGPELLPLVVASKDLTFGTVLTAEDMVVVL